MDRLEALTSQTKLAELRKKMEEMKRQNELEKKRLQELLESHEGELQHHSSPINIPQDESKYAGSSSATPPGGWTRGSGGRKGSSAQVESPNGSTRSTPSSPLSLSGPIKKSTELTLSRSRNSGDTDLVSKRKDSESTPQEVDEDTASKLKKRGHIALEIINTERDYVNDLLSIREIYLKPLQVSSIQAVLQHINDIFSNVEQLIEVNSEFCHILEQKKLPDASAIALGDVFIAYTDLFRSYTAYFINHPTAEAIVRQLEGSNKEFAEFLQQQQFNNPKTKGLTIFMFLIKPIQRICKYPLLLRNLLECTPKTHGDFTNLTDAVNKIEHLVSFLNEKRKDKEALQKVADIASSIEGLEEPIIVPTRRSLIETQLSLVDGEKVKKRMVFLFNDLLLIAKLKANSKPTKYTFVRMFPMSQVRVLDIANRPGMCYLIGITPRDTDDQITFMCSSNDEKVLWLTTLKKIVKEFQLKEVAERKGKIDSPTMRKGTIESPSGSHSSLSTRSTKKP